MAAIDTDNHVDDFVSNLSEIFEDNTESLGIKEIYKEDVLMVPIVPSIAISCTAMFNERITVGSTNVRYETTFIGDVWYYQAVINEDFKRNVIMSKAYKVARHIMKNASLNGWLVNKRAIVRSCTYSPRIRAGMLLGAARISLSAPKRIVIDVA